MARHYNAFSIKSLLIDLMLLKDSYTKGDIGSERKRINVACLCVVATEASWSINLVELQSENLEIIREN